MHVVLCKIYFFPLSFFECKPVFVAKAYSFIDIRHLFIELNAETYSWWSLFIVKTTMFNEVTYSLCFLPLIHHIQCCN